MFSCFFNAFEESDPFILIERGSERSINRAEQLIEASKVNPNQCGIGNFPILYEALHHGVEAHRLVPLLLSQGANPHFTLKIRGTECGVLTGFFSENRYDHAIAKLLVTYGVNPRESHAQLEGRNSFYDQINQIDDRYYCFPSIFQEAKEAFRTARSEKNYQDAMKKLESVIELLNYFYEEEPGDIPCSVACKENYEKRADECQALVQQCNHHLDTLPARIKVRKVPSDGSTQCTMRLS